MQLIIFFQILTIISLPLYILRFSVPFVNVPSTALELLILITFFLTVANFYRDGRSSKLKTPFDLLIFLFLANALLEVFFSGDLRGGRGVFKAYFLEPVMFFYSLVYVYSRTKSYRHIIYSLIVTATWLSILAILQKLTHSFSLAPYEVALGRIPALYNSANSLALFLGPVIFITLSLYLLKKRKTRWFFLFLVGLFSLVMVWTKSRGGLIAETVTLIIFLCAVFSYWFRKLRRLWLIITIILLISLALFFSQLILTYNSPTLSAESVHSSEDTLQIRYALWAGTVNLLKTHPVLGAGLNGFKSLYQSGFKISPEEESLQYPHNIILNFWVETGFFGLLIFLALTFKALKCLIETGFRNYSPWLGIGLICALIYSLVHGMVDVPYFKNDLSVEFWVILALTEIYRREATT